MERPASADEVACHLQIRGRVQGVGFRWSLSDTAARLQLRGWVRNRRDGSVEAVAVGAAPAVDALAEWAQRGPTSARVDRVEKRPAEADEVARVSAGFEQLPTL